MEAKRNYYDWIVTEGPERYIETTPAEPSSRVLDGSQDHGYYAEYVGYGTIDGVPVKAIYLFDEEDFLLDPDSDDDNYIDDDGNLPWDEALKRHEVLIDDLTEDQYNTLQSTGNLIIA